MNPSCQAIAGLLKAGKIKHEAILVDILKGKQKNLDISHFNPNASVPIIELENQTFVESQAIMRMLCNLFDQLEHFYPKNAFQRHKIDSLLDWHQTSFGPTSKCALGCLFNLRKSQNDGAVSDLTELQSNYEASYKKMQTIYMELEAKLEGNAFLNGDQVCVADFAVCS